ncbi:hypothetical protein [Chitinophaga arvensicola]|uniref:Uncharacterized protein n=1 Tax=Chitinophaga arvensicola TaxID=29529 RepID=A0A1I0S6V1_9BACT|nr:hypothetical protein [Chitinophaga arvensicola]SEW51207.1 hypothetical protein SAMN04488122_4170 [Chitinophaga arvensicola]
MDNAQNVLLKIHTLLSSTSLSFRQKVCEECNWSIPTFYRRIRLINTPDKEGKLSTAVSSAEEAMIIKIMNTVYQELSNELQQIQ